MSSGETKFALERNDVVTVLYNPVDVPIVPHFEDKVNMVWATKRHLIENS